MQFPPFRGLIPAEALKQLTQLVGHPSLSNAIKEAAQRLGLKDAAPLSQFQEVLKQAGRWAESMVEPWNRHPTAELKPGINATGELFSSRWTSQKISSEVNSLGALLRASYAEHAHLNSKLTGQLVGLTGSQDIVIAPNMSIALWLVATTATQAVPQIEIVLPRIHGVRIPSSTCTGGVPLRSILDAANAKTTEIGSAHDCSSSDFSSALTQANQMLLVASPCISSDSELVGIEVAKSRQAKVCMLALDGSLHDMEKVGMDSKVLSRLWDAGADLIVVPGNYFLGGPECAIILGKLSAIKPIRSLAENLGWGADAVTCAMLSETIAETESWDGWLKTPIGAFLSTSIENLESRAKRLKIQLEGSPLLGRVESERRQVRIGPSPWNALRPESTILKLYPKQSTASALSDRMAQHNPPIWGIVQSDHVELVLRSVEPDEDRLIVDALTEGVASEPNAKVEIDVV